MGAALTPLIVLLVEKAFQVALKPETQQLIGRAFDKSLEMGTRIVGLIVRKDGADPTPEQIAALFATLDRHETDFEALQAKWHAEIDRLEAS